MNDYFGIGGIFGFIVGIITFIGVWIGAAFTYGMWGFLLGWLPAYIIALIVGGLVTIAWPLVVIGLIWLLVVIARGL